MLYFLCAGIVRLAPDCCLFPGTTFTSSASCPRAPIRQAFNYAAEYLLQEFDVRRIGSLAPKQALNFRN